jgi:hypothetical protein
LDRIRKKALKQRVLSEQSVIREILTEWAPLPGSPPDEYDCLVGKVWSLLQKACTQAELHSLLMTELVALGIEPPKNTLDVVRKLYAAKPNA